MTRRSAWSVHLAALLVGGTGLVYGWMRYLCEPADEFALVNHPMQPAMQQLHVLGAPLFVFACAAIWNAHVWKRVRNGHRARRPTGLVLFVSFFPMVLSGGCVQVAESDLMRTLAIWIHGVAGVLFCAAYVVHQFSRRGEAAAGPGRAD